MKVQYLQGTAGVREVGWLGVWPWAEDAAHLLNDSGLDQGWGPREMVSCGAVCLVGHNRSQIPRPSMGVELTTKFNKKLSHLHL
jgi:hypothetical protein